MKKKIQGRIRGMSCDNRGNVWSDTATSQGTPRIVAALKARKRQGMMLPYNLQREQGPADTMISDFWSLAL